MMRYHIKASGKPKHPDVNVTVEQKSVILGLVELYLDHGYHEKVLMED